MSIRNESLADFMNRMRLVLDAIASNSTIAAAMAAFGYDPARTQEGQTLLDTLTAAHSDQIKEYAEQFAATEAVNQAFEAADKTYGLHRALGKRLFAVDTLAHRQLLLNEPKARRRSDWLIQGGGFYTRLLAMPEWVAAMGTFGQTQAMLEAAQTAVNNVTTLDSTQKKEISEAQTATLQRDELYSEARVWLATAVEVAHFALADNPQLIEAFDVVEPS